MKQTTISAPAEEPPQSPPAPAKNARPLGVTPEMHRYFVQLMTSVIENYGLPERLMTIDAVARTLGISRRMVEDLISRGVLPIMRIGRLRRVPPAAVRHYVRSRIAAEAEKHPSPSEEAQER